MLRLDWRGFSLLLTGDLGAPGEEHLLASLEASQIATNTKRDAVTCSGSSCSPQSLMAAPNTQALNAGCV